MKQAKKEDECCDSITCISDPNYSDDLTINIRNSQGTQSTSRSTSSSPISAYKSMLNTADSFMPSQTEEATSSIEDLIEESDGNENEFYVDQNNYDDESNSNTNEESFIEQGKYK